MKHILVLGAGLVARPYVQYMLDHHYYVTVASRTMSKAERLIGDHPNARAQAFDIEYQPEQLATLVKPVDLVISLLPYIYHVNVAKECLRHQVDLVTTSYVSDEMRSLNSKAKKVGVILLNECGVDPGQDHMSAMQIIHEAQASKGKIVKFTSFTGGLPAPEANTNPFGYKISWSPRGVLMAGRNSAKYLQDGQEVFIPGEDLFQHCHQVTIPDLGIFEGYPNRDSLSYIELYGIQHTQTMLRGTLRYPGWCATLYSISQLGLLDLTEQSVKGMTFADFIRHLLQVDSSQAPKETVANYLNLNSEDVVIKRLEWLGLFNDKNIPLEYASPLDVLCCLFEERLQYSAGERDMLVMQHNFTITHQDRSTEYVRSTLIDYGIPHGDSSMSRTVALPAAIASCLILEDQIQIKGVQIPVVPQLYEPILTELAKLGIRFEEKRSKEPIS